MRRASIAALAAAALGAVPALAQDPLTGGDPGTGARFARETCTPCHVVSQQQLSPTRFALAPSFEQIARSEGITATALYAFLTTPHDLMPNLVLQPDEAADVIAYILSLRRGP
jgi:cytochrome c2